MKILAVFAAFLLMIPATAQKRSKNETPELPVITQGISYSLPRTGIRVVVSATQTSFVPGPYSPYAEQLLGIRDAKTQAQTTWEITDVRLETFAEPDPENTFKVIGSGAAFLQLTPAGILAGINSPAQPAACNLISSTSLATVNESGNLTFSNLLDTPGLSGRSTADQRAVSAASRIIKARNTRNDIASGMLDEFHPDGDAYEASLEELRRTEKELLQLFTGKSATEKYTFAFDYVPTGPVTGEVIFRFDENRGFLPKSDLSGKPVMMDIVGEDALTAKIKAVQGTQTVTPDYSGVYYRQPGVASVRITRELTTIATGRATIAQLGGIAALPASLLDGNYSIEFHPETGAVKSILRK